MFGYVWVSCITFRILKPLQQHTTLKHWFDQTIPTDWVSRAKPVSETLDIEMSNGSDAFQNYKCQVSVSCRAATLSWWVALSTDWISSGYCDCLDLDASVAMAVLCETKATTNQKISKEKRVNKDVRESSSYSQWLCELGMWRSSLFMKESTMAPVKKRLNRSRCEPIETM